MTLCQCTSQPIDQTAQSAVTVVSEPSASPEPASPTSPPASPTAAPTEVTDTDLEAVTPAADPSATPATTPNANWISYNNADYGFSFRYPEDSWALIEWPQDPNLLSLAYHEQGIALRIRFKRFGEEGDLQLYGGAAGDFVERGAVHFLGEDVGRSVLVYEDIDRAVHYNETRVITRGDLQFTLALVSNRDYERGRSCRRRCRPRPIGFWRRSRLHIPHPDLAFVSLAHACYTTAP